MNQPLDSKQDEVDERISHMLAVLQPHTDEISELLNNYCNIVTNVPVNINPWEPALIEEARHEPLDFMNGVLLDACFIIANAEQNTKVTYPDDKIFDKLKADIKREIAEMIRLERGASTGRTH